MESESTSDRRRKSPGEIIGGYIPFAKDDEIANANRDKRDSIASLYNSFEDYLQKYEFATDTLIKDGYLLPGFKPAYMKIAQAMKTMFE